MAMACMTALPRLLLLLLLLVCGRTAVAVALAALCATDPFARASHTYGKSFRDVVLFYNADLFKAAGVATPTADWTWAAETAAAETLTDKAKVARKSEAEERLALRDAAMPARRR